MQQKNPVTSNTTYRPRLLLVDGYGFLFRAYHSLPPLTSPQGVPVGAVYGFINMLTKLLMAKEATYVAVVLDAGRKTFRHDLYDQYKANRPPAPEDLLPQFPLVRLAVEALNIPVLEKIGYEADDIIATYAHKAVQQGIDVTVISADKDLSQLINPYVKLYDPMKSRYITGEDIKEKYGVFPDKMLDLLALMGDSSDNIPGVPGVGPKTAAQLINEYGGFDEIFANLASIKQEKRRQALKDNEKNAILSRDLVRLCSTVPIEIDVTHLKIQPVDKERLTQFLVDQGFKTLLSRLEKIGWVNSGNILQKDTVVEVGKTTGSLPLPTATNTAKVHMIEEINQLESWLAPVPNRALLIMYLYYCPRQKIPLYLVLATETQDVAVVTIGAQGDVPQGNLFDQRAVISGIALDTIWKILAPHLRNPGLTKVSCDMKGLLKEIWQVPSLSISSYDDLMLMSYVVGTGLHEHDFVSMAFHVLGVEKTEYAVLHDKKATAESIKACLAMMGQTMVLLHSDLKQRLFTEHMLTLYEKLEKPMIECLAKMEKAGIKVNLQMLQSLSAEFAKDINGLEEKIFALAGKEFNIGSPKQLGEVLFAEMGLEGGKKSKKTNMYSTDAEVLEQLEADGVEIANHILQWRTFSKLKSTYTDALAKQIQNDGRVHTHYAMTAVNTGRLSSYDPNLQNIPIRTEAGNKIREVFIAEKGFSLLSADYSQIELRLLSHMADIASLKQAFLEEKDIHTITASQIFGVPIEEITNELRRNAKAINFGIIYGMSGFGLARRLGIERAEATDYINKYFAQYPGIRHYMERTKETAKEHGYITTLCGRRCYIKGMNDKNGSIRQFAERAAINAPLQGSAADIIKQAMVNLSPKLEKLYPQAKILLQVHDELVIEVPDQQINDVMSIVKHTMENVLQLSVPLTVSIGVGKNWRQSH